MSGIAYPKRLEFAERRVVSGRPVDDGDVSPFEQPRPRRYKAPEGPSERMMHGVRKREAAPPMVAAQGTLEANREIPAIVGP